jgi:hypothetical protein
MNIKEKKKSWQGCAERRTVSHCWWGCKLVTQENSMEDLQKIKNATTWPYALNAQEVETKISIAQAKKLESISTND